MNKKILIWAILDIEWAMFQDVNSGGPAPCQLRPEAFKRIRGSIYETWTEEAFKSCLLDVEAAQQEGRNLLTEKYARMDDLMVPARQNPLIDQIVTIETQWQTQIQLNYPALYGRVCRSYHSFSDGRNFSVYLRCELQTYSNRTIELYYAGVTEALQKEENLALRSLEILAKRSGYRDVIEAERCLSADERWTGLG